MTPIDAPTPNHSDQLQSVSDRLNEKCFCVTLDRPALYGTLERETEQSVVRESFVRSRPHLFSNVPVFLAASALAEMQEIAKAIEATSKLPEYRAAALSWAPEIAERDHGPIGALMGYDFHLSAEGPRLIEVNTNAGGAFLNALLARAQRACCATMEPPLSPATITFEDDVYGVFLEEWRRQRGTGTPHRIAIVDDAPEEQFLYPEFLVVRQVLAERGVDAVIADARDLGYEGGRLSIDGQDIDLVYNRVTDFAFDQQEHKALRDAYQDGAVVVTPNPHNHALLANKRNLSLLSDPATLGAWGVMPEVRAHLAGIPRTVVLTPHNADALWKSRKKFFFKPTSGHGAKAVYRGDKITRGVWAEIAHGGYIAQAFVRPTERMILVDGARVVRKMDVRLYTYDGRVLLTAARLYQGQATNFRTPGGGFAPVFAI